MKSVWTLSLQRSLSHRNQSINLQSKSMDLFLYNKDRQGSPSWKSQCFVTCMRSSRYIIFDYEKTIDIYGSRYPREILVINPLSQNLTVESFDAWKTFKAYRDFGIFSLYFIFVICKIFRFTLNMFSFYEQLGSGLSPQSCLYFQGFRGSNVWMVCNNF